MKYGTDHIYICVYIYVYIYMYIYIYIYSVYTYVINKKMISLSRTFFPQEPSQFLLHVVIKDLIAD